MPRQAVVRAIAALLLSQIVTAQMMPREKATAAKGPRALGLVELLPKGKARLTPIIIMIDGNFYDAGAYKATPVPMALTYNTVYEGFRDGISQGLFTVKGALAGTNNIWRADGTWQNASEISAIAKKKAEPVKPRGLDDDRDAPPVLRRPDAKPAEPSAADQSPAAASTPPSPPATAPPTASPATISPANPEETSPETHEPNDPVLRRGKPAANSSSGLGGAYAATAPTQPVSPIAKASPVVGGKALPLDSKSQASLVFPAISDARSSESHSYEYPLKPGEEAAFRKKMLTLAAEEVLAHDRRGAEGVGNPKSSPPQIKHKPAEVKWDDVELRIFDLSSNNEPVLILTATAPSTQIVAAADSKYFVTVVARQDIYGDLNKAFSTVTDPQHVDVQPRMELIDAIDVDGDGRGELLFRQIYESASAYVVYRVIGQQLYPLFQGSPSKQ